MDKLINVVKIFNDNGQRIGLNILFQLRLKIKI